MSHSYFIDILIYLNDLGIMESILIMMMKVI